MTCRCSWYGTIRQRVTGWLTVSYFGTIHVQVTWCCSGTTSQL